MNYMNYDAYNGFQNLDTSCAEVNIHFENSAPLFKHG